MALALRAILRFGSGIAVIAATGWLRHVIGMERAFVVFLLVGATVATPLYARFAALTFREITSPPARVFAHGVEEMLPLHRRWLRALLVMPVILLALGGLWVATAAGVGSGLMVVSRLSDPPDPPALSSQSTSRRPALRANLSSINSSVK
jgi:hypothetical protein